MTGGGPSGGADLRGRLRGPFFHGTRAALAVGEELVVGHRGVFREAPLRHVYFTALVETAAWGAQLSAALAGEAGPGRVYAVEPLGPFEDDPNVTDRKLPGNPTRSYRSTAPLRVLSEVDGWPQHAPEALARMLEGLARLRREGLDVIVD